MQFIINYLKEKLRKEPKVWFTSDWHFGHKNVINYCNRPYKDVEQMHKALIKIWNKTVKPQDTVYFLGDFSLNPKWSRLLVKDLNGKKIMVAGNHDACHISNKKHEKFINKYREDGWLEVYPYYLHLKLKNNLLVLLSHLPYDDEYDSRYKEYKIDDEGNWLLHGHLHAHYRKNGRQIDVALDGDMKLWSEDEIIALIEDKRDFIPTPITEFYKNRSKDEDNKNNP